MEDPWVYHMLLTIPQVDGKNLRSVREELHAAGRAAVINPIKLKASGAPLSTAGGQHGGQKGTCGEKWVKIWVKCLFNMG